MHKRWMVAFSLLGLSVAALTGSEVNGLARLPSASRDKFDERVLSTHNAERARLGLPPLQWQADLAADAGNWAKHLSEINTIVHSPKVQGDPKAEGENLWMGTKGAFSPEYMVGEWIAEKRNYRKGTFPDISTTGKWQDVGHYSQTIWPTTLYVGCAMRTQASNDFLVCRYLPAGNVVGLETP